MDRKLRSDHYLLRNDHSVVPCDVDSWARMFDRKDRHVAKTYIASGNRLLWALGLQPDHWVSTVFLGLDHNWSPEGPPLIFETMVFRRYPYWFRQLFGTDQIGLTVRWWQRLTMRSFTFDGTNTRAWSSRITGGENNEQDMERYSTWDEAVAGHNRMVARWMAKTKGTIRE